MKKEITESRTFYYDCGLCEKMRHFVCITWNVETLGKAFPMHLYERCVVMPLRMSFKSIHPKMFFFEDRIKQVSSSTAEHRSPKPKDLGSNPSWPAK